MARIAWVILIVLLCPALITGATVPLPDHVVLGRADAGKTFYLAKGGTLEIRLAGNPTTGYQWGLISGGDAVLKPVGEHSYEPSAAPAGMVGTGGIFIFRYRAVGTGSTDIKFGYLRPWEKNTPPLETYEVKIMVVTDE